MLLYRLRSIDAILHHYHELDEQVIYFASPDELNDPMEGFVNFFWKGDRIAWENLLRHFIIGLSDVFTNKLLGAELSDPNYRIPLTLTKGFFHTQEHQKLCEELGSAFITREEVAKFLVYIEAKTPKMTESELSFHLSLLNSVALDVVIDLFVTHKLLDPKILIDRPQHSVLSELWSMLIKNDTKEFPDEAISSLSIAASQTMAALDFHRTLQLPEEQYAHYDDMRFLLMGYTEKFIADLPTIIYPEWYTACFMEEYNNLSVWGHYAGGHRGICLIFDVGDPDNPSIRLYRRTGVAGNKQKMEVMYGYVSNPFQKVQYTDKFEEIDFFGSIGNLPYPTIMKEWFANKNGDISICSEGLQDEDKWRKRYWGTFAKKTLTKLSDWQYENEYRVTLNSQFSSYENKEDRKIKYEFTALTGIIFGMKTKESDRREIIKIIQKKCIESNRKTFDFYQAYYDSSTGKIGQYALSSFKFNSSESSII